jgi:hypothetical protein
VTRYCTFKCMEEAKPYHQWECGSNLPEHVGIAFLGLRVALAGEACEASGDESKIESYQRVCSLLTHISDMTAEDKLQYSLVGDKSVSLLDYTNSFIYNLIYSIIC